MKKIVYDSYKRSSNKNQEHVQNKVPFYSNNTINLPAWKRISLLSILGYEGAGALAGGILLVIAPDGRIMDMPVEILNGIFPNFLIPGIILTGLGILNTAAFFAVLFRRRFDWLLPGLGLGGLVIWFLVEIIILHELHWLHAMWGIPVLLGCVLALPLVTSHLTVRQGSGEV
jgi:hypothetical protein